MIELKIATWDHFPDILEMSEKFHQASPYKDTEVFDESRVSEIIIPIIESPIDRIILVLENSETKRAVGMVIGTTTLGLFSRSKIAAELAWWVDPEYRTKHSLRLLDGFLYWAQNVAKCDTVQMALLENSLVERLTKVYNRKGLNLTERAFYRKF